MDSREELVASIGRASAAASAISISDRTLACSHRWRRLKFVRATASASHTSGTAASSHSAAGAVHVSIGEPPMAVRGHTVILRCHVHHSASARANAAIAQ